MSSKLDDLYANGRGSRLDMAYSNSADPETGFTEREMRQYANTAKRVGRRAYKQAVKEGDFDKAMRFASFGGIQEAGSMLRGTREMLANRQTNEMQQGMTQPVTWRGNPGGDRGFYPSPPGKFSPDGAPSSSNPSGQWVQTGPQPARLTFAQQEESARARSEASGAFGGPRRDFQTEARQGLYADMESYAAKGGNPWDMQDRAISMGISRLGFASAIDRLGDGSRSVPLDPSRGPGGTVIAPTPPVAPTPQPDPVSYVPAPTQEDLSPVQGGSTPRTEFSSRLSDPIPPGGQSSLTRLLFSNLPVAAPDLRSNEGVIRSDTLEMTNPEWDREIKLQRRPSHLNDILQYAPRLFNATLRGAESGALESARKQAAHHQKILDDMIKRGTASKDAINRQRKIVDDWKQRTGKKQ